MGVIGSGAVQGVSGVATIGGLPSATTQIGMGPKLPSPNDVFFGTLVGINEKGWGFVSCEATKKVVGKDVFVLKSTIEELPGACDGLPVRFSVTSGQKGPVAKNVAVFDAPDPSTVFQGSIRSYQEIK